MNAQLLILDFGSQFTQLIARAVRELGVYCEIVPGTAKAEVLFSKKPKAFILSGGPSSVNSEHGLFCDPEVFKSGLPVFGICYGMQIVAKCLGGVVEGWGKDAESGDDRGAVVQSKGADIREFGPAYVQFTNPSGPFKAIVPGSELRVWMSHGDKVTKVPSGFEISGTSEGSPIAAFANESKRIYGVQFHPEVHHTTMGKEMLRAFLFDICKLDKDWDLGNFAEQTIAGIRERVPHGTVICGLSGGVDSTVAAVLVQRAIGERLHCIFVDNGLLRQDEATQVYESYLELNLNVTKVDAGARFLSELAGVTDPEKKRKIIGRVFIEVFEEEAKRIQDAAWLVQGTLYPDVIESTSVVGKSVVIKSHHNVGGLTENMKLKLIEPLRELFKDEVRAIGRKLSIPDFFIDRQPFPGPGLAVRCLGAITEDRLKTLRAADKIVRDEVDALGLTTEIWQSFAVLLPVYSVGVMGDGRTYEETIAIRAVTSRDGMTADWYMFPEEALRKMSTRIINETPGVNRVVLDISTKPPATIEWE